MTAGLRKKPVKSGRSISRVHLLLAEDRLTEGPKSIEELAQTSRSQIQSRGLEDRCKAVECDFFKDVQAGSDGYLMSHVLHDWYDNRSSHDRMKLDALLSTGWLEIRTLILVCDCMRNVFKGRYHKEKCNKLRE